MNELRQNRVETCPPWQEKGECDVHNEIMNDLGEFEQLSADRDAEGVERFKQYLYEKYQLGGTGGPLETMSVSELVDVMLKVTKLPELQGILGAATSDHFVYLLSFHKNPEELIEELVGKMDTLQKIDFLHASQSLVGIARANGNWAEPAARALRNVSTEMDPYNVIEEKVLSLTQQHADSEYENPSYGVLRREGQHKVRKGEYDAAVFEEAESLHRKIAFEDESIHTVSAGARDAYIAYDHALTPIAITRETLEVQGEGYNIEKLQKIRDVLNEVRNKPPEEINLAPAALVQFMESVGSGDAFENLAVLTEGRSAEEWRDIFSAIERVQDRYSEIAPNQQEYYLEASNENLVGSLELISDARNLFPREEYLHYFGDLERGTDGIFDEDDDTAYGALMSLLSVLRYRTPPGWSGKKQEINDLFEKITLHQEAMQSRFTSARQKYEEAREELYQSDEFHSLNEQHDELLAEFFSPSILEQMVQSAEKIMTEDERPVVQSVRIASVETSDMPEYLVKGISLLQETHRIPVRRSLEESMGHGFEEFSLREQIQIMGILSSISPEQGHEILDFVKEHNAEYGSLFLLCSNPQEAIQFVNWFQELDRESQEKLGDVANLVVEVQDRVDEILEQTYKGQVNEGIRRKFVETALKRLSQWLEECMKSSDTRDFDIPRSETITLVSIMRSAFEENPDLRFEDVRSLTLNSVSGREIEDEDKRDMLHIFNLNWVKAPKEVSATFREKLESALASEDQFHLLRKSGEIIGFMRFQDIGDGKVNATSFNIRPDYRGSKLGETFLRETVEVEAQESIIVADSRVENPALEMYINRMSLVGVDLFGLPDDNGGLDLQIILERRPETRGYVDSMKKDHLTQMTLDLSLEQDVRMLEDLLQSQMIVEWEKRGGLVSLATVPKPEDALIAAK